MDQFEPLDSDEVLYVPLGRVLMMNPTFKVGEFIDALAQAISDREPDWSDDNEGWFGEGLDCEALRFQRQGWQRGRVRIRLEFCPDEPRPSRLLDAPRREREPRRMERLEPKGENPYRSDDPYRPEKPDPRFDDIYGSPDDNY